MLLIFLSAAIGACGKFSKEVVFESRIQPNLEYLTEMKSVSTSKINFIGPKENIDNIKANGIQLPMLIESSTSMKTTLKSYDWLPDSSFKTKTVYDNIQNYQIQNGERTESDSPLSGLIIEGTYNSLNKFTIDTLISEKLDDNTRTTLIHTLENVQDKIVFPEYPMSVGDTFEQELPMNIPVAGVSTIEMILKTKYKLKKIRGDIATFNINQIIELNMDIDQANVSATGTGKGISEFDISNKFITKYESDLTIRLLMNVDQIKINAEIKAESSQNVTIK
jgi:hypothetical protein